MDLLCFHSSADVRNKISMHLKNMDFKFRCYDVKPYKDIISLHKKYNPSIILTELHSENIEILEEDMFVVPLVRHVNRSLITKYANRDFIIIDESLANFKNIFMGILILHRDKRSVSKLLRLKRIAKNMIYAYGFEWGKTFIVRREFERKIYDIIPKFMTGNINLFMALRNLANAPKIRGAKVVWVTDIVGKDRIKPHNLTILTDSIIRFIEENENAIVLVDCVEYLLLYNDFINVLRNIELINSYVMEKNAILIIITDNNAYTNKEYSLLRRYAIEWSGE